MPKAGVKTRTKTVEVTEFFETCPTCGTEISADSEKRLAYLMKSHKFFKHSEAS